MARLIKCLALAICSLPCLGSSCDALNLSIRFVTPEKATSTETHTAAMPDGAKLVVSNDKGSIRITVDAAATEATIEVERTAWSDSQANADDLLTQIVVNITEPTADDNTLKIDAPHVAEATGDDGDFQAILEDDELSITAIFNARVVATVALRITLPPGHEVEATNVDGAIRAIDLDAAATLTCTDGSVRCIDADANVTIRSTRGDIIAQGHRGTLDARTEFGDLKLEIRSLAADQTVTGRTIHGDIDMSLPSDVDAELTALTDDGRVYFFLRDFDEVGGQDGIKRRSVRVMLNGGGPAIDVQTDRGTIAIGSF